MKNFSELLATNLKLTVSVNEVTTSAGLHDHLKFNINDQVIVDGIEILPKYQYLAVDNMLTIHEPFYCWLHRVSGQGWLLEPQ